MTLDVLSVGRVSVDLYALEPNQGFDQQQSFQKSIGGSPTNLAVAAARLGHSVAIATKVGDDDFGNYVRNRLSDFGVKTDYVLSQPQGQTPLALAALTPPETPKVIFYRGEAAPDTTLVVSDVPAKVISSAKVLWISQGSLAKGSTAETCLSWMRLRSKDQYTILDLDYRPSLWENIARAREMAEKAISLSSVVVGNREECEVALGTSDAHEAADLLLAAGVKIAVIKLGADGSLFATQDERVMVPTQAIDVVCGLGAGDAFGGALCHGLLEGWDIERIGRVANAAGALVSTRLTCSEAMPSLSELDEMIGAA